MDGITLTGWLLRNGGYCSSWSKLSFSFLDVQHSQYWGVSQAGLGFLGLLQSELASGCMQDRETKSWFRPWWEPPSQNGGIAESQVGRDLKDLLIQPHLHRPRPSPPAQLKLCYVQHWGLYHFYGEIIPMAGCSHCKIFSLLHVQPLQCIAMGPEGHTSHFQDQSNLHSLIRNIPARERQNHSVYSQRT